MFCKSKLFFIFLRYQYHLIFLSWLQISFLYFLYFFLLEQTMESTLYLEKINIPSSKLNPLDLKAQNSIKRHKVRAFINAGTGSSHLSITNNDQNSQLAEHLMHLKTSCSGVKVDIKQKELQQFRYKDQTAFLSEKAKEIQNERQKLEDEVEKLKSLVEEVRGKEMNAMMINKSHEHILDRMKKDEIRYLIKKNQLEKELSGLEKEYKELRNRKFELKEFEYMSATGLKEAQSEVEELKSFRKTTMMNMNQVVDEKEVLMSKRQERKEKSRMIKEMAAGDLQDAQLIQLKKFLSVQMLLKTLLKGKIEKLKDFYEPYELAFLKIKGNTNVKDANTLKSEYHNFQISYNQKAAWVKHLEDELEKSDSSKRQLSEQLSNLKLKQMQMLEQIEQDQNGGSLLNKQLGKRAQSSQIMMMQVRGWLLHQALKMGISSDLSDRQLLKAICCKLRPESSV